MPFDFLMNRVTRNLKKIELIGITSLFKIKYFSNPSDIHIKLTLPIVNNQVLLRNHSIDKRVFKYVFYEQWHKPIPEVRLKNKPVILDLGANIGLSILTFNHWYPGARIIGYEMDDENFKLACKNTFSLENVLLVKKAVHFKNSAVTYLQGGREDAYSTVDTVNGKASVSVQGATIDDILTKHNLTSVDYLKMDIEGSEVAIFDQGDLSWLSRIKNLNVEFHLENDADIQKYVKILEEHKFRVFLKDDHWASLTAIKVV